MLKNLSQRNPPEIHFINGYTLIELLVVLTIISIIASSAIPAYSAYTVSSRQTFAITTISKISLALENYYSEFLTYETDLHSAWANREQVKETEIPACPVWSRCFYKS